MSKFYPHLLSPLKIRGKIMPSRMAFSRGIPIFICGTNDVRPLDSLVDFSGDTARNGAAIVAVPAGKFPSSFERSVEFAKIHHSASDPEGEEDETGFRPPEPGELKGFDMSLDEVRIKYARVVEAIHGESSLACISMMDIEPFGWTCDELSTEQMEDMIDNFVDAAKSYYSLGFDVMCFYMSAGMSVLGMSLSPVFNTRTDRFGGSNIVERASLVFEIFDRVRKACPKVLIEAQVYVEDADPNGYTFEDLKDFVQAAEGKIDIIQLRGQDGSGTSLDLKPGEPYTLSYAAELKKLGTSIKIAPVGGFQDPSKNNEYIRDGKCDFVYMAHAFLCDPEYGKKVLEGRPEDIMPCLHCNKCHSRPGDPDGGCSVNPQLYLSVSDREYWRVLPAAIQKKVAVVGGGPAGMEAALIATRRGHSVTLYEKDGALGGQLYHSDYFPFKWNMKLFKDYLIAQVKKSGITVRMDTKATPDMLAQEGYDAIILASGAICKSLPLPGAEGKNIRLNNTVCGHEDELGNKIVVVGGSETGCEFGLYLARMGKDVTVLEMRNRLANDAQAIHYREYLMDTLRKEENFHYITHATAQEFLPNGVVYKDKAGNLQNLEADTIIVSSGVSACQDDYAEFAAAADEFYVIGDCKDPRDVRHAMKSAFCVASRM